MEWSVSLTQNSQARAALPFIPADVAVLYLPGPPRARFSSLELDHTTELISGAYSASRGYLRTVQDKPNLLHQHRVPTRPDGSDSGVGSDSEVGSSAVPEEGVVPDGGAVAAERIRSDD